MKKSLFFAVAATVLSGCASDELVDVSVPNTGTSHSDIRFTISQKNTTRGYSDLNKTGHYNFGVFAYKSTDKVNSVMPNYLVGYCDGENGYEQNIGSTWGDQAGVEDGKSWWAYEGLGSAEYNGTYAGGALTDAFKSNNANQYLKYWDNAADYTCFYAYAPYINGVGTATYVDGTAQSATGADTYVLTIPNGTLKDGYDDPSLAEYMYASAKVEKANYGHDVALQFHRLNAKVNIKFWEDVPGWKVRILDLGNGHEGVKAAASIKEDGKGNYGYKGGKYYTANGVKIKFNDGAYQSMKQFEGTLAEPTVTDGNNATTINFKSPSDAKIGENRYEAALSPTTYYAIPKGDGANVLADGNTDYTTDQACDADLAKTGFTFHVSYELTAEDTGEKIVVKNASVHVPYDYCNWKSNTHYTYIFKITRDSNGSTDPDNDSNIDPTDPEVPTVQSLYPIVFDNCTVLDWEENESEWDITDGTQLSYHNIALTESGVAKYSYNAADHTIVVSVEDTDLHAGNTIAYNAYDAANAANGGIAVTDPSGANVTTTMYTAGSGTSTIALTTATASGVYTVTYYCPTADLNADHPKSWSQTFFVGDEYTVATHHTVIGTKFTESEAKLTITTTKNTAAESTAGTSGQLYIEYPANFTTTELTAIKEAVKVVDQEVVVKNTALAGEYKLVYKITEGAKEVKVAEQIFTVKDYTLKLNQTVVFNDGNALTVKGNQAASTDNVYTTSVGSVSGNAITVPNTTADNTTVTVTYTVWNDVADVAKTTYTATFVVKDTHSVTVDKTAIDRNEGTSNIGDYTTDNIVVTTLHNGVATTEDLATANKLAVVKLAANGAETATTSGDFTITQTAADANTYNLKVKNNVATGDYYVKYVSTVGGADKAEYVHFVVTE